MNKALKCCRNCEYWDCYHTDEKEDDWLAEGECRRYPPSIPIFDNTFEDHVSVDELMICLTKGTLFVNHPFTFAEDWCGEFKCIENPKWFEEDEE